MKKPLALEMLDNRFWPGFASCYKLVLASRDRGCLSERG
jgi:hypothetical protein